MTTGIIHNDQNLERQIEKHMGGCMAGFFNLFDRNHILSSHHHSPPPNRCLPAPTPHRPRRRSSSPSNSSSAVDSSSETVSCLGSPSSRSVQFDCKTPQKPPTPPSSDKITTPRTPPPESPKSASPSQLAVSSVGTSVGGVAAKPLSPWKFSREAPRLSLDSRAVVDAKGKLHPRQIRTEANIINILPNNNSSSSPMTSSANRRQSNSGDDDSESDSHRRSPSVVARLMGLEPLTMPPDAHHSSNSLCRGGPAAITPDKRAELRRSVSESRSRDLLHYHRFLVDGGTTNNNNNTTTGFFTSNISVITKLDTNVGAAGERGFTALDSRSNNFTSCRFDARQVVDNNLPQRSSQAPPASAAANQNRQLRTAVQPQPPPSYNHHHQMMARKGFYDSGDYFPDIKPPSTSPVYGEIEKRFRTRGGSVGEPSRDLVTLKQIVEALQLKGLLHSATTATRSPPPPPLPSAPEHQRIRGGLSRSDESPIVFMRQAAAGSVATRNRSFAGGDVAAASSRREMPARRPVISPRSPGRIEREREMPASSVANAVGARRNQKNQGLSAEKQGSSMNEKRRGGEAPSSPRMGGGGGLPKSASSPRRSGGGNTRSSSRIEIVRAGEEEKPLRRGDKEEDGFSTVSESSYFSTSTDTERSKMEDHRGGRSLLERCDKLLHSIAEMNASVTISTTSTAELQPSPVSVLDSSFYNYKEEEAGEDQDLSPSPITTAMRTLHFRDQHLGESNLDENSWLQRPLKSSDVDLVYVTDIVRASNYLPDDSYSDLFLLLEKHQSLTTTTTTTTKASMLQRRLLFDATAELLDCYQQLPPWKLCTIDGHEALPRDICNEIQRIKPKDGLSVAANDLFEVICGVMKRDLDGNSILSGWGRCHVVEVSEAVLDIERLIFKDLIGETIQDVAALACKSLLGSASRRRLVF